MHGSTTTMLHKRARESTSDKENSSTSLSSRPVATKKQRLDVNARKSGYQISGKNKVHVILQEQARARYARDILTPPPSSEMDVHLPEQEEHDEELYTLPRRVQFQGLPSSQNRFQTPSSPVMPSSPFLPTTPLKEDGRLHALPVSLATLSIPFDGTHNLILGRSRKNSPTPTSHPTAIAPGPTRNPLVRGLTLPTHLPAELADKVIDPSSPAPFRPTRLVPLPRKAQHTSRHHVLLALDPKGASHLLIHVLGQNGCRVRVLGARVSGTGYERKDEDGSMGKRYTAGRVITIRSPVLPGQGKGGSVGLIVDVEIDMYSCKTIVHWSVPPTLGGSDAEQQQDDEDEDEDDETESDVEGENDPDHQVRVRTGTRMNDHRDLSPEAPSGQNGPRKISSSSLLSFRPANAALIGTETVAPLSPPTSSPRRLHSLDLPSPCKQQDDDMHMDMDMSEDARPTGMDELLNDLPPSSPPMDLDPLPLENDEIEDERDDQDEQAQNVQIPGPVIPVEEEVVSPAPPALLLSVKSKDFALVSPVVASTANRPAPNVFARKSAPQQAPTDGFFGFGLGGPSRKNVVVRKVMVKNPNPLSSESRSRENTPRATNHKVDKEREEKVKSRSKEVGLDVEKVKPKVDAAKQTVSRPKPVEPIVVNPAPVPEPVFIPLQTVESIPETPLPLPPADSIELATPSTPLTPSPATLEAEATPVLHPASSPARSIYSQMTSDSEDEAEPGQVETAVVLRRLGEMKSKAVKKELIDAETSTSTVGSKREENKKRKSVSPVSVVRKEVVLTTSVGTPVQPPVKASTPAPPPSMAPITTNMGTEEPTSIPNPPVDLDLKALVATSVVFSGVSAISAFDLVKTILDSQPSMRTLGSDATWASWIGDVLRGEGMFGRVDRKGKDSSGHPLLPLYYYLPANDPDQTRAAELGACMRPLRGVQRGGGKAIDWRPVGSRGRR